MAPRDPREQTYTIISFLFDDGCIETDGPGDDEDLAKIGAKLREIGDALNDDKTIHPLIQSLQIASSEQVAAVFGSCVDTLCQSWVAQRSEVASEKDMLKASVALGLYVKKNCPDMVSIVHSAMTNFLNTRLGNWVASQGGWDNAVSC